MFINKESMVKMLDQGLRLDSRRLLDYRNLEFETNVITTAEGSARVKLGNTEILAGVKLSIDSPFADTPDEGILMVEANLIPLSNPRFELGPPGTQAIEFSRVIDRAIRESKTIDLKKLVIKPGEKVWSVSIDIVPLNYDGNLIDVGVIAALLALKNTRFPKLKNDVVDYKEHSEETLFIREEPIAVTIHKVGKHIIIDTSEAEERLSDARLTIVAMKDNRLCALQKGGDSPLTFDDIEKMIDIALEKSLYIRKRLK